MTAVADLTVKQLAKMLQVSESWLHKQVAARAIPHHRRGRAVRFTPQDVAEIRGSWGAQPAIQPPRRLRLVRSGTKPGTPAPSDPPRPPDRPAGPHTPTPPPGPRHEAAAA